MFTDARSKRLVLVAHCLLNQNAKLDRCAFYPGAIREAAQVVMDAGVGILQMPCPELICLGLERSADPDFEPSVEEEDTRIASAMREPAALVRMHRLAVNLASQVEQYQRHGFTLLGVVGINGSPTCAVERTWYAGAAQDGPEVFSSILQEVLAGQGVHLAMRGIRAAEPQKAVQVVESMLCSRNS